MLIVYFAVPEAFDVSVIRWLTFTSDECYAKNPDMDPMPILGHGEYGHEISGRQWRLAPVEMAMGSELYVGHGRHGPQQWQWASGSSGWHGRVWNHRQNGNGFQVGMAGMEGMEITAKWQWVQAQWLAWKGHGSQQNGKVSAVPMAGMEGDGSQSAKYGLCLLLRF